MFYQYLYPIKGILSSWTSIYIGLLSLVRFLSTNYIRIRCHSIISHFTMSHKCRYCGLSFKQTHTDYDMSVTHTPTTSRYDAFFVNKYFRRPRIYINTWIMFIRTEHSPVRPVSKHSVLNDTYRYTKTIAHQDPFHHNQDQVDSFDAVDVHRASTTGVNSTFTECAIIFRRERVWDYRIHLEKTIVLRGANLTIQFSKTPTNPMLPSF